jgi:hypothetical protein
VAAAHRGNTDTSVSQGQSDHDRFSEIGRNVRWNARQGALERGWAAALGLFFIDSSKEKLEKAATHLTAQGYRFVGIHEADDGSTRVLHVERVEQHCPKTLFSRNEELYGLADRFGLQSYDGMDVGPAPL